MSNNANLNLKLLRTSASPLTCGYLGTNAEILHHPWPKDFAIPACETVANEVLDETK